MDSIKITTIDGREMIINKVAIIIVEVFDANSIITVEGCITIKTKDNDFLTELESDD